MDVWHEDGTDRSATVIISLIAFAVVCSAIVGGAVVWLALRGGL